MSVFAMMVLASNCDCMLIAEGAPSKCNGSEMNAGESADLLQCNAFGLGYASILRLPSNDVR